MFRVNTPHVIHEVIDGEAVVVNLQQGSYFSLVDAGAQVWALIQAQMPVHAIVARIDAEYQGGADEIEAGVGALLDELEREGLIVPDERRDEGGDAHAGGAAADQTLPAAERPSFVTPVLRKYTDMEDLLLLDPIHDVDDAGWPNRAADHTPDPASDAD